MAKLNMAVSHRLTQDEALKRIKALLGQLDNQGEISNLREEWDGNTGKFSFSAMGVSVYGILTVNPSGVDFSVNFPFAALLFKRKIESTIRERAETLLA